MIDDEEIPQDDFAGQIKKPLHTDDAPTAIGPYSQAIVSGNFLFMSGQIPVEPTTGDVVAGEIEDQTVQIMKNIGAILEEAGGDYVNVVKTTIFLTDIAYFKRVNEIYAKYFPHSPPARSTVQVSALPMGVQVEIEAIARLTPS